MLVVGSNNINRCDYLDVKTTHIKVYVTNEIDSVEQDVAQLDLAALIYFDREDGRDYRVLSIYTDEVGILNDLTLMNKAYARDDRMCELKGVSLGIRCNTLSQLKMTINEVCDNFFARHPELVKIDEDKNTRIYDDTKIKSVLEKEIIDQLNPTYFSLHMNFSNVNLKESTDNIFKSDEDFYARVDKAIIKDIYDKDPSLRMLMPIEKAYNYIRRIRREKERNEDDNEKGEK